MFEAACKGLARRGHRVDVISPYPLKKPYPNYTDLFEFNVAGVPDLMNNLTFEGVKEVASNNFPGHAVASFAGDVLCEGLNLPGMQQLIKNPPKDYDLIVSEVY